MVCALDTHEIHNKEKPLHYIGLIFVSVLPIFQARENMIRGVTLRQAENRRGLYHLMNETINPGILSEYGVVWLSQNSHM